MRAGSLVQKFPRVAAWLAGSLALVTTVDALAEPRRYEIDPAHTFPMFEVGHLGFSRHRGRFNTTRGALTLDRAAARGELEVVIAAETIDTGHDALEKVLRGDGFFDVERFPELRFRSTRFEFDGDRVRAVVGELTLLGQTRPLRLELDFFHCGHHLLLQREVCGANATGTLRRSDFGMDKFVRLGVGDEVKLSIQVEAHGERAEPAN